MAASPRGGGRPLRRLPGLGLLGIRDPRVKDPAVLVVMITDCMQYLQRRSGVGWLSQLPDDSAGSAADLWRHAVGR